MGRGKKEDMHQPSWSEKVASTVSSYLRRAMTPESVVGQGAARKAAKDVESYKQRQRSAIDKQTN
jgi:hypothetical protein